jgi:hypothetical protein
LQERAFNPRLMNVQLTDGARAAGARFDFFFGLSR